MTRVAVLQTLCEIDSVDHALDEVLRQKRETRHLSEAAAAFMAQLSAGVLENIRGIDSIIMEFAPSWPISQMAIVDRNLLRMAIYEISIWGETPPRVAINEAVELAKAFGSESSPRFVNGVLGSVMKREAKHRALSETGEDPESVDPNFQSRRPPADTEVW